MRKLALPLALVFGFAMVGCSDDDSCVDVDGDGYGEGSGCLGPDCDDDDMNVWMDMEGYPDVDEDGVFAEDPMDVCTDGTLPAEYSATAGTDCDDTAADAYELVEGYVDADGDGYGTGDVMDDVCGSDTFLPPGYADNGDDCDDASDMAHTAVDGYQDYDEDGVFASLMETLCTDGTLPATGWSDTAGTDCDDDDVFVSDDSSAMQTAACNVKGTCADTEFAIQPDFRGVGACQSIDCNGQNPAAWEPIIEDTSATCDASANCTSEICFDPLDPLNPNSTAKHCWNPPTGCNSGTMNCGAISTCIANCNDTLETLEEKAACYQFQCIEMATPKAQWLYNIAQTCAANAGCFALARVSSDAVTGCALSECNDVFMQCIGDTGSF